MTLLIAATSRDSLWLAADRRLSWPGGYEDGAVKQMILETRDDGVALLGYAGLGKTRAGTQPSEWMAAVLRARNLPLEDSLGVLAEAVRREVPPHMGEQGHLILAPAFQEGRPRLYGIGVAQNGKTFVWTRFVHHGEVPPRVRITGSGAPVLDAASKHWLRPLLTRVRAVERGVASPHLVADYLAKLIYGTHKVMGADATVGPTSTVLWRFRPNSGRPGGGGAFYTGEAMETDHKIEDFALNQVPTIANGMDINALASVTMAHVFPQMIAQMEAHRAGENVPEMVVDGEAINRDLAKLPDQPDERLR